MFVTMKGDVIHAYLGYNIVAIQKELRHKDLASLIKETAWRIRTVIDSTQCINFGLT
jgi:hypothetical protein